MISVRPKFKALSLCLRATAGGVKMPLAQAHPFQPMAVTHEEEMLEVSSVLGCTSRCIYCMHYPWLPAMRGS